VAEKTKSEVGSSITTSFFIYLFIYLFERIRSFQLERLKQEKGKAAMLEQDSAKLNELLQASSQEKAKIQDWLTRKYTLEAKAIAESWKELSTQLASSRTRVDTITSSSSSFGIFKSSGKALEQSRAIEQIEIEVQQWQTRYKNFLETWLVVAELGYVDVPDIALRLNEIKRQEQSRPVRKLNLIFDYFIYYYFF